MSINNSKDENFPTNTDDYYEKIASQEEVYLEETEEHLRAILIFDDLSPVENGTGSLINDIPALCESPSEPLNQAAEELITGDSDDPPLSDDDIGNMLKTG